MAQKSEPPVRVKKLLNASFNGDAQEVQLVIDKNKKWSIPLLTLSDNDGNTALHKVCAIGYILRKDGTYAGKVIYPKADYPKTLEMLLKEGVDKTVRNKDGETALNILKKINALIENMLLKESPQKSRESDHHTITRLHELLQE